MKKAWLLIVGLIIATAVGTVPLVIEAHDFEFAVTAVSPSGTRNACFHEASPSLLASLNNGGFSPKTDDTGFIYSLIGYDGPVSSNPAAQTAFWALWNQDSGGQLVFSDLGAQSLKPKSGSVYAFNFGNGSTPAGAQTFANICQPEPAQAAPATTSPPPTAIPNPTQPVAQPIARPVTLTDPTTTYLQTNYEDQSAITKDWGAMALSSLGVSVPAQSLASDSVLTNARNALARLAQGQDATTQLTAIKNSYQNNQFGDPTLINDDIFSVMALRGGDPAWLNSRPEVYQTIVSSERSDGSFGFATSGAGDVDITSAAIWAIGTKNQDSTAKALSYLSSAQNSDGGLGYKPGAGSNIASSAWAMLAWHAIGKENDPLRAYLVANRHDGYWLQGDQPNYLNTAYATLALSGKTIPIGGVKIVPVPLPKPKPTPITVPPVAVSTNSSSATSTQTTTAAGSCSASATASASGGSASASASASCN